MSNVSLRKRLFVWLASFILAAGTLAARIEHSCKGGGSDACFLPDEWRTVLVR